MTLLNSHANGLSETDMLNRLKAVSTESEPQAEPTEQDEPVSLQADDAGEAIEAESEVEESTEEEAVYEESEEVESEASEVLEQEEDSIYLIGDEEISLNQLKELKEGSLRQSDYTRKTQELAEQRKELEAKAGKVGELTDSLSTLVADLETAINDQVESVDWNELADLDPSEYLKKKAEIEVKQQKLSKAKEAQAKALQEKANDEFVLLNSKMPEWIGSDGEAKRQKDTDAAMKYAAKLGFTDADFNKNVDHKFYMLLIKAAKFDALKEKAPAIKKKVARAPKVTPATKSAQKKVSKLDESKQRLRKSGTERDALNALKAYMGG